MTAISSVQAAREGKTATTKTPVAVLYLRVSTERQVKNEINPEGLSVPSQREACLRRAADLGAEVDANEFVELAETAKMMDRPELQRLLRNEDLLHRIDYVIIFNLSRFARLLEDQIAMIKYLQRYGVKLISATEHIDETAAGKFMTNVMGAVNQLHSDLSAEGAVRGMTRKASEGGTPFRAPIGYRNVKRMVEDRPVKMVEIDPERGPLVQWAFDAYATGEWTISSLHEALVERGLKCLPNSRSATPGPISRSAVGKLLHDRYYLGYVIHRGIEYEGRHQALISQQTFDRVQQLLRSRYQAGEKQRTHNHYLKGSVFCGRCGSRLCITRAVGKGGGEYLYFFCLGRQMGNGCRQRYVQVHKIEEAVERYYDNHVRLSKAEIQAIRERLLQELGRQQRHAKPEIAYQRKRVKDLEEQRRRVSDGVAIGAIPMDVAPEQQRRIAQDLANAHKVLAACEAIYERVEEGLTLALQLLRRWHEVYLVGNGQVRRHSNQALFEKLLVDDGEVVGCIYKEPWATLKSESFLADPVHEAENPDPLFEGQGSRKLLMVPREGFEPSHPSG